MDIEKLYRDYNIDFITEGNKHCQAGWVQTHCPFCQGSKNYHLGYNTNGDYFNCWRCGGKTRTYAISNLINVPSKKASEILRNYGNLVSKKHSIKRKPKTKIFKLPDNIKKLSDRHKRYLEKRDFDPDYLEKTFGLMSADLDSRLKINSDKYINYKHRIIIPYYWDDRIVTFDARDATGKMDNKYMACPIEREEMGRKDILYGIQNKWKDSAICVEGPSDVWRFGVNSFAVSGIKYKQSQVRLISKLFKRIVVIFDKEITAQSQANKLIAELKFRGVDAIKAKIEYPDPGSMPQKEADYLVKQFL